MTSPGALLPPDSYYWVCALTWAACFFGAKLAVRHPRPTLYATIAVVPLYLLAHLTFQGASAGAAPDKAIALFDALKSAAVFFPVVLYAFATLKLAERAREHESTRAREHESVPRWVGRSFSGLLCLNLLVAIIPATSKPGLHSAIYAVAVVLVGLMALQLKWEIKDNTLGFTDRPFTLSYLASLTYLLFFINPPGSGWISFFVLLVPYLPFSRAGHAWMAYRAYSLWIFLTFAHVLGLIDFYRTPPAALDELLQSIRHSTLSEIVLLVAVVSVGHLTWQRWTAFRRNSSTTSRANVANQETSGN